MLNCAATRRGRDKKPGGNILDLNSAFNPISALTETQTLLNSTIKGCDVLSEMKSVYADTLGEGLSTLAQAAEMMTGELEIAALRSNAV